MRLYRVCALCSGLPRAEQAKCAACSGRRIVQASGLDIRQAARERGLIRDTPPAASNHQ